MTIRTLPAPLKALLKTTTRVVGEYHTHLPVSLHHAMDTKEHAEYGRRELCRSLAAELAPLVTQTERESVNASRMVSTFRIELFAFSEAELAVLLTQAFEAGRNA